MNKYKNLLTLKNLWDFFVFIFSFGCAIGIVYFYFLNEGPMYHVVKWMEDTLGYYSLSLAFGISYIPVIGVYLVLNQIGKHIQKKSRETQDGNGS